MFDKALSHKLLHSTLNRLGPRFPPIRMRGLDFQGIPPPMLIFCERLCFLVSDIFLIVLGFKMLRVCILAF